MRNRFLRWTTFLCSLTMIATFAAAQNASRPRVIVLVIDGLRPDVIRPDIMPNLARMKQEGAWCANSHSVFPTVTRVNSASISTGSWPSVHGIVSNSMWVDTVSPRPFDTSNYQNLVKLAEVSNGRTLPVPTLAETLEGSGIRFVGMGSGSTGGTFLLNPMAIKGNGVLISSGLEEGKRVAFPDKVNLEIQRAFGTVKPESGIASVEWAEKVLRGYVLKELRPGVVIDWITEPDGSQHRNGVGSPEALAALKADDEQIGLLLAMLRETPEGRATDLIVTADHGFAAEPDPVDLNGALQSAGVASDVIVASNGSSALIYAKNHDAAVIQKTVEQLQRTDGVDVIFTAAEKPASGAVRCVEAKEKGWVAGTFALELIHECRTERGADLIVTFQWTSEKNEFGFPGIQRIANNDKRTGVPGRSGHGGLNPWMVHTPLLFWGPDFGKKMEIQAPTANYDIAPTILALEGIKAPASMTGRAITEVFSKSKTKAPEGRVRTIRASSGQFCSEVQVSEIGARYYVDQGHRCR
jgi:predicted AlkP superfamily pyrophosphatase or phosphodiesterase